MSLNIERFENITIAYMRNIGEYGVNNIKLMEDLKDFLKRNKLFNESTIILGIALDNPAVVSVNNLRYDVGVVLEQSIEIDLDTRKIDDGTYAVFEVIHTEQGVASFWKNIQQITKDLPVDEMKPVIERYTAEKIENLLCEFCVPLKG